MNESSNRTRLPGVLTAPGGSRIKPRRWPWLLFLLVTLATLWAGLDPKGYRFRNEVEWIEGRPGVRFGKFGRVQTAAFMDEPFAGALNRDGFTLLLAIDPDPDSRSGFRVLASVHAGDDGTQLVVGQWREFVIVMNGDDYDNKRRRPRVTGDISLFAERPLLLGITSTAGGTSLFLNGEQVAANARLHLTLPVNAAPARLLLGNSAQANQPWAGEVGGFELLPQPLTARELRDRCGAWRRGAPWPGVRPVLAYPFDEAGGDLARDHGSSAEPLTIPPRVHALGARALAWDLTAGVTDRALALDVGLNFVGFLPFGAAAALALMGTVRGKFRILLLVTLAGLGLSLVIELTQAWLPSRDSSLRDLLLNTAGTPVGAIFGMLVHRWKRR